MSSIGVICLILFFSFLFSLAFLLGAAWIHIMRPTPKNGEHPWNNHPSH